MIRPVGTSAGGLGLAFAWLGGVAIAKMSGATPVVIVLAAGFVMFVAALVDGMLTMLRTHVGTIALPHSSTQGDPVPISGAITAPRAVFVEIRANGEEVALGWTGTSEFSGDATFGRRGAVDELEVRVRTAGLLGLVWWGRRFAVPVSRHLVAPAPHHGAVAIERAGIASDGDLAGDSGAISGEIDGVRPWRDGDSEKFVHWSSSMRSGELVVHDRRQNADQRWVVRARSGTAAPDEEAGAARWAIEQGLRSGAVVMAAVDDGQPEPIADVDAGTEWTALVALGATRSPARSWRDRFRRVEPDATATASSRWWAAAATLASLWMLTTALGYSTTTHALVGAGVAAGAYVSTRTLVSGEQPSPLVRALIGVGAVIAFAMVAASSGRIDGLLEVLRGPLPQVLMLLVVLHGFECRDRRTIRVGLGISAVIMMYASGLRVDGDLGWWLLLWGLAFGIAMAKLSGPTRVETSWRERSFGSPTPFRTIASRTTGLCLAGVSTLAVLAVVPVPEGPARLTLPTLITDGSPVPSAGGVAGPDGGSRDAGGPPGEPGTDRAPAGQAGGYTGFADTMDTSVRGDLSDEIVMRVRASEPDFWRGQTFSEFDGRRWYADQDPGTVRLGPNIMVPPALGDTPPADDIVVERFLQTYFLEVDMPNIVFHSSRPNQVIAETDVWTRPDGALRAAATLPAGSVYTVVSDRVVVDAEILRRQRHIGPRLSDLGRQVLGRYLDVPASTSPETIALADALAAGEESTYDVVRAYEAWMNENVEYDLDAPLPAPGEDAVHDFLFDSQLGFCEQIASSLTVMLRTQGVPARLVTGYVSGTRDEIAGVYEVRASDAHAWVEVWFPATGWQAFDPTAAVPLSANADVDSVGADLMGGLSGYLSDHLLRVMLVVGGIVGTFVAVRALRIGIERRRRGRWGNLQDRFAALAAGRGAPQVATNGVLADAWDGEREHHAAQTVADRLDRVVCDPTFVDGDDVFAETRELVGSLRSSGR